MPPILTPHLAHLLAELEDEIRQGMDPLFPEYKEILYLLKYREHAANKHDFTHEIRQILATFSPTNTRYCYLHQKGVLALI